MAEQDDLRPEHTHALTFIPIPGAPHMVLGYDPQREQLSPQTLQRVAQLIAASSNPAQPELPPTLLRAALRVLHDPRQLGSTELAGMLFADLTNTFGRGQALKALLERAIGQLAEQPSQTILHAIYLEDEKRLALAKRLHLSEREYQRQLNAALEHLATILAAQS